MLANVAAISFSDSLFVPLLLMVVMMMEGLTHR